MLSQIRHSYEIPMKLLFLVNKISQSFIGLTALTKFNSIVVISVVCVPVPISLC